jgi:hypothetical protein
MSNLPVQNSNAIPMAISGALSRTEKRTLSAYVVQDNNPRVCEMNGEQITNIIMTILAKIATRLGSKPKDLEEQMILERELNSDLVIKFPTLTDREIMMALENGLDGMYQRKPEDPVIFNPSNFVQWVRSFIEQTKKPVMKKVAQLAQQAKAQEWQVPESEQLKMSLEYFKSILKRTLDGEAYEDFGNVLYMFLSKIGFMIVADADKWKAIDLAKLMLISDARENKEVGAQRIAVQKAMELIQKSETEKPDETIISMAKRILITQKLEAFKLMPEDEQSALIQAVEERVEYMCIELKDPEQYSEEPEQ